MIEELTQRFLHRDRLNDEALRREIRAMAHDTGEEAFVRQTKAIMSRADSRLLPRSIRCPTLVLVGEGDELTPPERAQVNGISGAKFAVVPECGHFSTLEKPETVNAVLADWLGAS